MRYDIRIYTTVFCGLILTILGLLIFFSLKNIKCFDLVTNEMMKREREYSETQARRWSKHTRIYSVVNVTSVAVFKLSLHFPMSKENQRKWNMIFCWVERVYLRRKIIWYTNTISFCCVVFDRSFVRLYVRGWFVCLFACLAACLLDLEALDIYLLFHLCWICHIIVCELIIQTLCNGVCVYMRITRPPSVVSPAPAWFSLFILALSQYFVQINRFITHFITLNSQNNGRRIVWHLTFIVIHSDDFVSMIFTASLYMRFAYRLMEFWIRKLSCFMKWVQIVHVVHISRIYV